MTFLFKRERLGSILPVRVRQRCLIELLPHDAPIGEIVIHQIRELVSMIRNQEMNDLMENNVQYAYTRGSFSRGHARHHAAGVSPAAISSNVRPVPSRVAALPANSCHRLTITAPRCARRIELISAPGHLRTFSPLVSHGRWTSDSGSMIPTVRMDSGTLRRARFAFIRLLSAPTKFWNVGGGIWS